MEQPKNEESELEEGEISEDADDSKRSVNKKYETSAASVKYINLCRFSSTQKASNARKEPILRTAAKYSTQNKSVLYNKKGRNSFFGRLNVSSFSRKKEFRSDNRSGIGSQTSLQKLRYDAKFKGSTNRPNYVPRVSSTSIGYRNLQRPVFHSNANHKLDNTGKFTDVDNDASYEDLLEQYRQIKCRLNDLNEEESKQLDKNKSAEKSNKSHALKLGNNKENWQQKQSLAKKWKSSSISSVTEHTSTCKGSRNNTPKTTQVSRKRRPYEYHKQSRKSKVNLEKYKQKQHRKDNNNSANEDDEDLLELRNQALATLSKQSTCNKIKETCIESKPDNNNISTGENSQVQNASMFNVLGDNYEQVSMDLDSDVCPDSPQGEITDNKIPVEDPQFGEDIDEEELRKQLLQSLVGKKRQQEQVEFPAKSESLVLPHIIENELLVSSPTIEKELLVPLPTSENELLVTPITTKNNLSVPPPVGKELLVSSSNIENELLVPLPTTENELLITPPATQNELLVPPATTENELLIIPPATQNKLLVPPAIIGNELLMPPAAFSSEELAEKYSISLDDLPKNITHNIVATTEPLVINLAEDSSSEDESDKHKANSSIATPPVSEELPPGLEQLIKDARMQSEKKQISIAIAHKTPSAVQKLSKAQQLEYRKLKEEIAKRESVLKVESKDACTGSVSDTEKLDSKLTIAKSEINREQERLQNLKIQLARKRFIARNSEVKVQKLKEQLAAAERVLAVDMQMIKISNAKIKEVQLSLHKKVLNFQAQQKKQLQDGIQMSEIDKMSKVQVNGAAKQNRASKFVIEKRNSINVVSNMPKAKMTATEIVCERERLQKLEKEVALQLEELRRKSRKTLSPKKPVNMKVGVRNTLSIHNYKRKYATSFDALSNTRNAKKIKTDVQDSQLAQKIMENASGQKRVGKLQNLPIVTTMLDDKLNPPPFYNHRGSLENVKDYYSISKLLNHYNRLPVLLYSYQLCDIFWPKLEKLELDDLNEDTKFSNSYLNIDVNYSYVSPLLHMHSYRLHPHFVSQEAKSLSSNTYANGLDVKSGLCRFDLLGTCNDDQCTWQHEAHYKLSNEEIIADLLAYAPVVSGIISTDNLQQAEMKLMKTSAKLLEEKTDMSLEETCRETVSKVNAALHNKAPNFVPLMKRSWKPHTKKTNTAIIEEWGIPKHKMKELKCDDVSLEDYDFDNQITDADKRYYSLEEKVIDRLEEAVTENKDDIQLWLKLAYKYLHSSESPDLCLEQALNVLSRALESNQDNPELWQNYLNLYAQHPSSKDVISVCQEALQWCPRYEIWWKYLQLTEGYENKYEICSSFLEYLMSNQMQPCYNTESISHCILEILLYQVQLSLQVGKYETAIMTFKTRLKKYGCEDDITESIGEQGKCEISSNCDLKMEGTKMSHSTLVDGIISTSEQEHIVTFEGKCNQEINVSSPACDDTTDTTEQHSNIKLPVEFMTKSDYCFAWLCYIYLTEFNSLPSVIFQNGEDRLAHVISKNPFLVDWTQCHKLQSSKEAIKQILAQAACCCMSDEAESVDICFPLYFQIVTIELSSKNYALAVEVCEKLLAISPSNASVWLLLSRVYAYQSLEEEMIEILMKAMVSVPFNPYICYATALFHFTKGNTAIAKEILENLVQSFFYVPNTMPSNIFQYTELLYCKALQHDNGRIEMLPKQKDITISEESKVYLWLNYILYLQCYSCFHSVVLMTFETALASFHFPDALKIIWWQYLQYSIRHISKGNNFKGMLKLLSECKIIIPTNVSLPHWPGKFKNYFGFHMTVVGFILDSIASTNNKALAAEKFLKILPKNVALIHRIIHCYLTSGEENMALSLLGEVLNDEVFSAHLWRIAICLILKTRDKQEAHKFYSQAIQVLPYNCILWLEYFLYEVSENHLEHVEKIKKECRRLQIDCIQS